MAGDQAKAAEIRKEFDRFDKDGNGEIDMEEFVALLGVLAPGTDPADVRGAFSLIDEIQDGRIEFGEFLIWWQDADWNP